MPSNTSASTGSLILPQGLGILFFDYDGTLVNTMDAWLFWINRTYGTSYDIADVDTWEWFSYLDKSVFDWFTLGVYRNDEVVPFDHAPKFLKTIRKEIETKILTATHCNTLVEEKNVHAMRYFGDIEVIHHMNKSDFAVCKITGKKNIIIDDKPATCEEWAEKGGVAILLNHNERYTYAKTKKKHANLFTVSSLDEVPSILAHIPFHTGENDA